MQYDFYNAGKGFDCNKVKLGGYRCIILQGNTGNFAKLIKSKLNYLGPVDLTQYFVKSSTIHDEEDLLKASTNGNKGVQVDFIFSRRLLNQVLTVFLPTIAIVIVSFCTSLFKVRAHYSQGLVSILECSSSD